MNTQLKKLRSINDIVSFFKDMDDKTAVTYCFIKSLCDHNKIKCFKSGNRYLIVLEDLLNYLGVSQEETPLVSNKNILINKEETDGIYRNS